MRRDMDRKEQERKKNQKIDFLSGGTQPGIVAGAPKINVPVPGLRTTQYWTFLVVTMVHNPIPKLTYRSERQVHQLRTLFIDVDLI